VNKPVKSWMAGMALVALVASAPAHGGIARAVEFINYASGHYFQTADVPEAQLLLGGPWDYGTDWVTTGQAHRVDDAPGPGLAPVCRFYTSAFAHKATHFFTAVQAECDAVKSNPSWFYEGIAFYAALPGAAGECTQGSIPIHRLYNNGQGGAPNHAYTPDAAKRDLLVQHGWIAEGTAYCAKLADEELPRLAALAGSTWDFMSGTGVIFRSTFAASPKTDGSLDADLQHFGLPPAGVALAHAGPDGTGVAVFDRIAGVYGVAGFERADGYFFGWTFGDPVGPFVPACRVDRVEFRTSDGHARPVQPHVLTCTQVAIFRQ